MLPRPGPPLLPWWPAALLFGGRLACFGAMQSSGASRYQAESLLVMTPRAPAWPVLARVVALAASGAFMLPVAMSSNAIVFATEQVHQAQMTHCGRVLNGVCNAVISARALWVFA